MNYLLDTNVLSEPVKPRPNEKLMRTLTQHDGALATASIVIHELQFGCLRLPASKRRDILQDYIENTVLPAFTVLPYTLEAANWHAQERARLVAQGIIPQFADGQIAAIAHIHKLVLVTRNTADFQHFNDIDVENWFA